MSKENVLEPSDEAVPLSIQNAVPLFIQVYSKSKEGGTDSHFVAAAHIVKISVDKDGHSITLTDGSVIELDARQYGLVIRQLYLD